MPPLAAIERFFERIFERQTARFFRTRLQPVQLQRRIERAMEAERLSSADRTLVPNRYVVYLAPDDLASFGDLRGTLASELADGVLAFARAHRYTLVDRPRVELRADPAVSRADVRIEARFSEASDPEGPALERQRQPRSGGAEAGGPPVGPGPETMVFAVPRPEAPRAQLHLVERDGTERRVPFEGQLMTIGRATDNGLVVADGRVSRHHARITARRGTLVYTDLGSSNGSRVNGAPVEEVVLGVGDRIELGDALLVVEAVDAAEPHGAAD